MRITRRIALASLVALVAMAISASSAVAAAHFKGGKPHVHR